MTLRYSTPLRNAQLNRIDATLGASPLLEFYSGAAPASCAAAPTGVLLASVVLPLDAINAAAGGVATLKGVWAGTGIAAGNAGYFRLYDAGHTTCVVQGSTTATGGGGDMELSTVAFSIGVAVSVTTFTVTAGNP